jgi:hypothetical protein
MNPVKALDQLRVARTLSRISLTEIALVSGKPRWRVQQIFAGTHTAPTLAEVRALQRAVAQLERITARKKALIDSKRQPVAP